MRTIVTMTMRNGDGGGESGWWMRPLENGQEGYLIDIGGGGIWNLSYAVSASQTRKDRDSTLY